MRSLLVSYVGAFNHGDVPVRSAISKWCTKYNLSNSDLQCISTKMKATAVFELKSKSTFCLEPIGDSIGRKSLSDSIACGCIPVFFGIAQAFQYPIQWEGWHSSAFVQLDRLQFITGALDPVTTLEQIQMGKIMEMQSQIQTYGGRFTYSLKEKGDEEDGVSVMLSKLWSDAREIGDARG
eukprot:TRINITY_DN10688_c0_g4_i1.p1 TRINITY_DN10688_c0_g4~~TRINITY_DN10688_c0_g4_i1.p1  ORF type:complete len:180 (-),score=21.93 TRINITY_DN10688_c0_g4_i1:252-791(-)